MMLPLYLQCCYLLRKEKKNDLLMNVFECFLSLLSKITSVSVVFDSSESLINVATMSPIKFPVYNNGLSVDVFLRIFFPPSPLRLSFVSVVFDFIVSVNDIAPLSPISFPVV